MKTHMRLPFLLILGLGLLGAAPTRAQQIAEEASARGKAPIEGIHVSGLWTFEIYDPDGRLVKRRTVQNALSSTGRILLRQLLSREKSVGHWELTLFGSPAPCAANNGFATSCFIMEPSTIVDDAPFRFKTLEVREEGANIVLQGNFTASLSGSIGTVRSSVRTCDAVVSPSDCIGAIPELFTQKEVSPGIDVQENQHVAVTVVIGFN